MMRKRYIVVIAVMAVLLIPFYLYGRLYLAGGYTANMVGEELRGKLYENCGKYTVAPGAKIVFSKEFTGGDEVRCYILIERASDEYAIHRPRIILTIEPPPNSGLYQYTAGVFYFNLLDRFSNYLEPEWASGVVNKQFSSTPSWPPRYDNDDVFIVFTYKAGKKGFPVKITLEFNATVDTDRTPWQPERYTGPPKKLAQQLGFKDVKEFMNYMGYDLCGEFYADDTSRKQVIHVRNEIDLSVGKACYILLHPPPNKTFLLTLVNHTRTIDGDTVQYRKYYDAEKPWLLYTPSWLTTVRDVLGLGYGDKDVTKPYEDRTYAGLSIDTSSNIQFTRIDSIILIYAYKGDSEVVEEPFRFRVVVETTVEFYIIQPRYGG
jgi:hypothetical protein